MSEQRIQLFNLKKEKDVNEFLEVSIEELVKIDSELMKYKVGAVQKQMLVKLFNYEKKHNKMMCFKEIKTSIRYGVKFSNLFLKRLMEMRDFGLIYSFFDEDSDADIEEECYSFDLTPKGKRFIDFMWSGR